MTATKNDQTVQFTTCVDGLQANFPATTVFVLGGQNVARDDLVTRIKGCLAAATNTKVAHDAWLAASKQEQKQLAALHPLLKWLRSYLENLYGGDTAKLGQFGFTPTRPQKKTAASKASAAAKAQQTRQLRGATGKKKPAAVPPASPAPTPTKP